MKDQSWDINQTWPVGRKWCQFTNAPNNLGMALPQIWGRKKHQIFDHFFATSALNIAYLLNETSHWQTKMLVSITIYLLYVTFDEEILRSVHSLWPTPRRPLRCNHQSWDTSSSFKFYKSV